MEKFNLEKSDSLTELKKIIEGPERENNLEDLSLQFLGSAIYTAAYALRHRKEEGLAKSIFHGFSKVEKEIEKLTEVEERIEYRNTLGGMESLAKIISDPATKEKIIKRCEEYKKEYHEKITKKQEDKKDIDDIKNSLMNLWKGLEKK
jgi:hypothetical protein